MEDLFLFHSHYYSYILKNIFGFPHCNFSLCLNPFMWFVQSFTWLTFFQFKVFLSGDFSIDFSGTLQEGSWTIPSLFFSLPCSKVQEQQEQTFYSSLQELDLAALYLMKEHFMIHFFFLLSIFFSGTLLKNHVHMP